MPNRFERLERFLPPAHPEARNEPSEPATVTSRSPRGGRRRARTRVRTAARYLAAGLSVAALLATATAVATSIPTEPASEPGAPAPTADGDVSLGNGEPEVAAGERRRPQVKQSSRDGRRRERGRPQREPRRVKRRIVVAAPPQGSSGERTQAEAATTRPSRERDRPSRPKEAESRPEPAPAAPQTPLYHCATIEQSEHFMTIDEGRAEQLSSPQSGWTCEVVGRVYRESGSGLAPVELDDGRAYVPKRPIETEPESDFVILYRHWAGYDWWYSTKQADGGFTGYIAV